jgi:hypothetical protein
MSLNRILVAEFFPSVDRFTFKASLIWRTRCEVQEKLPESLFNPLDLNYEYITYFRPECVGSRMPGLVGSATFIDEWYWRYNIEKNSYHARCLAKFIAINLRREPPLSNSVTKYSLEISFALVEPNEALIFLPPLHLRRNIPISKLLWHIRRRIGIFLYCYKDPGLISGISLFVVYDKNITKKRGNLYWKIKEFSVEQVVETFGFTPPVFRGYRLGRDGKLIIPKKPSKKGYPYAIPSGRRPIKKSYKRLNRKRRRRARKREVLGGKAYGRQKKIYPEVVPVRKPKVKKNLKTISQRNTILYFLVFYLFISAVNFSYLFF